MNAEIWLVRHGQSAANAGLPSDDPGDIPLTERGRGQAADFAEWMQQIPATVWTSAYVRARDTAAPTLSRFGLSARTHAQLHEFVTLCPQRCAGTSNLQRMPWVQAYWERSDPAWRDGEQAESFLDFAARVHAVRRDLHDSEGLVLVFGHGMFFAMWIWQELGFEVDSPVAMAAFRRFQLGLPMPNTGVYRLLREGTHWRLAAHAGRMSQLAAETAPDVAIQ